MGGSKSWKAVYNKNKTSGILQKIVNWNFHLYLYKIAFKFQVFALFCLIDDLYMLLKLLKEDFGCQPAIWFHSSLSGGRNYLHNSKTEADILPHIGFRIHNWSEILEKFLIEKFIRNDFNVVYGIATDQFVNPPYFIKIMDGRKIRK